MLMYHCSRCGKREAKIDLLTPIWDPFPSPSSLTFIASSAAAEIITMGTSSNMGQRLSPYMDGNIFTARHDMNKSILIDVPLSSSPLLDLLPRSNRFVDQDVTTFSRLHFDVSSNQIFVGAR